MSNSISEDTIFPTVVFRDAASVAVGPDSGNGINWRVYLATRGGNQSLLHSEEQAANAAVSTGTYRIAYAPQKEGLYTFEARTIIGGTVQVARIEHEVTWV